MTIVKDNPFHTQYLSNRDHTTPLYKSSPPPSNSYQYQHQIYSHIYSLKLTLLIKFQKSSCQFTCKQNINNNIIQNKYNFLIFYILTNFITKKNSQFVVQLALKQFNNGLNKYINYKKINQQSNFVLLFVRIYKFNSQKVCSYKRLNFNFLNQPKSQLNLLILSQDCFYLPIQFRQNEKLINKKQLTTNGNEEFADQKEFKIINQKQQNNYKKLKFQLYLLNYSAFLFVACEGLYPCIYRFFLPLKCLP
ncbi:transmembrane protein, putative (macronuclear) [Tetrahymena thermophila SB210]|uniref:Transmembrane protein, putative n=1 Tax=Tetrahymena thermophila (strain SB210) TaxID=312017 RepID=I7M9Z8_TETTS|nr:transmembrane protein, putative [Tetrahymena thermophila SB210]EAS03122.1 transmembrane protein, putative [Tetrahymena thermophila SB210]|eukprot:XP_001023367.1 transmembrane protein, putative [Tetrahymena thermophila SB210]